ncbi:MAG: hypothetical protein ACE5E5_12535 [Phycisphaerae bacterium]
MKMRMYRWAVIGSAGMVLGFLPGCVEQWVLNLATPFLLSSI